MLTRSPLIPSSRAERIPVLPDPGQTFELYILRGVPGSGKSGVATALSDSARLTTIICSADAYFTGADGEYRFDPELLPKAHSSCYDLAYNSMRAGINRVIIDNCNVAPEHFRQYEQAAAWHGYRVIHLVIERRHEGVNSHGVPAEFVEERARQLHYSIKT